jgi:hypothetical protein
VIDSYAWRARENTGFREAMLRFGPEDGPFALVLPPLFEEANRTRHFLVEVMRCLAAMGIASILPDLPGTNDSPVATVEARFENWKAAVAGLPVPVATVAVRGGALLDDAAATALHWRLAPENGARLLRDMLRATAITADTKLSDLEAAARAQPTALAGNLIHPELFVALEAAVPGEVGTVRTVRMEDDAGAADTYLPGAPLWRRVEPGHDPALADAVAADIAQWMTSCGAR